MADLLALGAIAVRVALQLWQNKTLHLPEQAVDIVENGLRGMLQDRQTQRLVETIEERVVRRASTIIELEFRGLPDYEREAAISAVHSSLERCALSDVIVSDLDAELLRRRIVATDPNATRDLNDSAVRLYDHLLASCCVYIVGLSYRLPGFQVGVFSALLQNQTSIRRSMDDLVDFINGLLSRIPDAPSSAGPDFESHYLRVLSKQLNRLEVAGLAAVSTRPYDLTTAYIGLDLKGATTLHDRLRELTLSSEPEGVDGARLLSAEEALSVTTRLYLRGEAGCGKTTVLKWIAVQCARGQFSPSLADWNRLIPFYIKLRTWSGRRLPKPSQFLEEGALEMPDGWAHSILTAGRAVVLIDGVDELPQHQREEVQSWLTDLIYTYPDSRYVISSRPSAASEGWLDPQEFDVAHIEPMRMEAIRDFVTHWHEAFLAADADETQRAEVAAVREKIISQIVAQRHLRQLATSPLVAALLCALHMADGALPQDRMELYSTAIDLLMAQRKSHASDEAAPMSTRDAKSMLESIAHWFLMTDKSVATNSQLRRWLGPKLRDWPNVAADIVVVVRYLLDRSGMIREPRTGQVDFIHRTFQEYLSAKAAMGNDQVKMLIRNAHDDQWHQVVIMAAGHARNKAECDQLITGLLDRAQAEPINRVRLNTVAVACLETAQRLSQQVRLRVQNVAKTMLPPRNMTDAETLAAVGELALDLVSKHPVSDGKIAAAIIRMASQIGGPAADREMARCASVRSVDVRTELLTAWAKASSPASFARTVLAHAAFKDLNLTDPGLLSCLPDLQFHKLTLSFPRGFGGSLALTQHCSGLRELRVHCDPALTDLSGLAGHTSLKVVELGETGMIDIEPLATLPLLAKVQLVTSLVRDLDALSGLNSLTKLELIGAGNGRPFSDLLSPNASIAELHLLDAEDVDDLSALAAPQMNRLHTLRIRKAIRLRNLSGIEQWQHLSTLYLQMLSMENVELVTALPKLKVLNLQSTLIKDLSFAQDLPHLQRLHVGGTGITPPSLMPLKDHPTLSALHIGGLGPVDLQPFAGRDNMTITIYGRRRRVVGADLLGSLSKVQTR